VVYKPGFWCGIANAPLNSGEQPGAAPGDGHKYDECRLLKFWMAARTMKLARYA
jgi:hypothetical protein